VVLLPGAGSTRTAVLGQAAVPARHGYGALLTDIRGHGRSGGHAMDFGWWGDRDLAAAMSFLGRQSGVRAGKIAVLGESMGGEQALAAAGGRPTLIIAAGSVADEPVAARWFRAASPATVQVWVVPHAGHTQSLAIAPQAWEAHVIGFLDAALKP
jgi:pimeloyl-ACP methyl ester carboxylesterase